MITSKESIGHTAKDNLMISVIFQPHLQLAAIPIARPETKKERKERCANGQINRVHIAIASFQTPRWPIGEGRRSWEKIFDGFPRMCIKSPSKEE